MWGEYAHMCVTAHSPLLDFPRRKTVTLLLFYIQDRGDMLGRCKKLEAEGLSKAAVML